MEARARYSESILPGGKMGTFHSSLGDFAQNAGFSVKQVVRLMKRPHADKFIRYSPTYIYDTKLEKRVRGKCLFQIALYDPSIEENEKDIPIAALSREQARCQNVRKKASFSKQPNRQNVENICNIYNNINIAAATANTVVGVSMVKGEQSRDSESVEVAAAVRKYFKNQISTKKIMELIGNTSVENVKSQLEWFPYRDNFWARKGPVVAFIVYCEQQLEKPDAFKAQRREENIAARQEHAKSTQNGTLNEKMQHDLTSRRARYENAGQYDDLFRQIIEELEPRSTPAKAILRSCFIGEIRCGESIEKILIDTPNKFLDNWLERNYKTKIVALVREKIGTRVSNMACKD